MKRFYTMLISCFVLLTISYRAQADIPVVQEDFILIAGKVIDSDSRTPLHFASVNLLNTNISNVTNSEGIFTLKLPLTTSETEIITISHLGYHTFSATISQFKQSTAEHPYIIKMVQVPLTITPATVRASDAEFLFHEAFGKIKDNYPQTNVSMTAFYREMIKKGSSKYLALNEAVIDILKAPYGAYYADKAAIYKGRGSINYDSSDTLFIKYQGGVMSSLQIDLVKNPFAGVYLDDVNHFYSLKMGQSVIIADKLFYVIEFDQRPLADDEILYRGKVYIESESLAIGRIEFSMNVEGREDAVSLFIHKKPPYLKASVDQATYIVNYKEYNGLWYYDYARMEVQFSTRRRYALFKNYFSVISEIAVTDHKEGEFEIPAQSRIRFRDMLSDKVASFTDENFWESYNVIEPDQSIDKIIGKIIKQLKKREKQQQTDE